MSHWPIREIFFGGLALVAWILNAIAAARKKAAAQREGRPVPTGPHGTMVDPQAQEQVRLRRIREETERRIAERKILMRPAPPIVPPRMPPAVQAPILFEVTEEKLVERVVAFSPNPPPTSPNAISAVVAIPSASGETRSTVAPTAMRAGATWLEELREPATVRRAILLREILGPPVGLR